MFSRMLINILFFSLLGCIAPSTTTRELNSSSNSSQKKCNDGIVECSIPGGGGIGSDGGEPVAKIELRHLIDPFTGTYQRKLTIPKNYRGEFYLSGLNFQSLREKHIYVRFKFGMAREQITFEATLGRGQGITPATNIDVLILDLSRPSVEGKRFDDLRLLYDLYDYNEYGSTDSPTNNNLDINLFCRGLYLEDDPTFQNGSGSCSASTSECRYAYAKVLDKGLMKDDGSGDYYPIVNLLQNIDFSGRGYVADSSDKSLRKCLPDRYPDNLGIASSTCGGGSTNLCLPIYDGAGSTTYYNFTTTGIAGVQSINGVNYYFDGAFRSLNKGLWQISGDAIFGEYGIFDGPVGSVDLGYGSKLFPIATKLDLNANVEHLSSSTHSTGSRSIASSPTSGETDWMDGCNARVSTLNKDTNEHIGSCNVSAEIQILEKDLSTGEYKIIAGQLEGGKDVKLQITRDSETNTEGNEVLYSALNSCENSNACGSNECCFNNRCWSDELVSICPETAPSTGNLAIGATCATDFECSSLCCGSGSGRCEVHNNSLEPAVLCSKPPGQSCIAKEWCMKQTVRECYIVKTGTTTCEVRCYNVEKFGDCVNGVCAPPSTPSMPIFNPADPNACDVAIDPPY